MPQYCTVHHRIDSIKIDGEDPDRNPDRVPVTGTIIFTPLLAQGDSVVITEDGVKSTLNIERVTAQIQLGQLMHRGELGVKLFAGGENSNPERIRWRATFKHLIAGTTKITLKDVMFEAVPGGELTLSMAQPVPGKPYPGYSATIEAGIAQIEGARDEALGQVGGAVDVAIGTRLDAKADVSTVSDLTAVTTGFMGVVRRNSSRIQELVSGVDAALAGKADTGTVDELSALVVSALGAGRRNADRIRQLASATSTTAQNIEARVAAVEAIADLSPESPVDGQTASLISQPDSLTRAAVTAAFGAAFQEDPAGSGLYTII